VRDPRKVEDFLQKGLAVRGVRDRADLLARLANVLQDRGKTEEAQKVAYEAAGAYLRRASQDTEEPQLEDGPEEDRRTAFPPPEESGEPIRVMKNPGPNDPCPCGSGKKYKKCCGH